MKESDIRVDDNMEHRWNLTRKDQERILQKKDEFVEVNCPACESDNYSIFYERTGFNFDICQNCETVFVNPRPTINLLIDHYKNSLAEKYWNEKIYPQTEINRVELLVKPRLSKIYSYCEKYDVTYDTLLDVGAGYGTFCEQAVKDNRFRRVIGVEPDPSPAKFCREKNIEIIKDFIENVEQKEIADVVTSIENIEHVFSPKTFLQKIYNILKVNGLLVLSTPNIKGFDLLILKDKSDNTAAPDHLNYFHPNSIKHLLENNGFEVLELITPGKLDVELVRKKHLEGKIKIEDPFWKRIIIDEFETYGESFQKWLAEQGLSSHMWVIARKK